MSRIRLVLLTVVMTALAAAVAACGGDDPDADNASPDTEAPDFPVSIEHKFGTTTIEAEPGRVVTLGFSEQDPVLGLGVVPVAVREWFGEQPFAVWPWAQDELGDAEPTVIDMSFGELDYETLATLSPDVIMATHSGITEDEYARLSELAPTVAQSGDYPDFGVPWQEQTRVIGRALGRVEQADALIADVGAQIEAAAEAHPEFEGATVAWASPTGDGQYNAVGPTTPPMRFLSSLGLTVSGDLEAVLGDSDSVQVGAEQMSLLDADVLILPVGSEEERAAIENDPVFQQLEVSKEGRTIFVVGLDDPVYASLSFSTALSLPLAIDEMVPRLADALE